MSDDGEHRRSYVSKKKELTLNITSQKLRHGNGTALVAQLLGPFNAKCYSWDDSQELLDRGAFGAND